MLATIVYDCCFPWKDPFAYHHTAPSLLVNHSSLSASELRASELLKLCEEDLVQRLAVPRVKPLALA